MQNTQNMQNICNIILYKEGDIYECAESLYFSGDIDPTIVNRFSNLRFVFTAKNESVAYDDELNELDYNFEKYTTEFFIQNREIITTFMYY